MNTLVKVARYHLIDRFAYLALPWGLAAFTLLVNVLIAALVPRSPHGYYTGALLSMYVILLVCGVLSMTRSLPFVLMLGVSRRAYYLGTSLLVVLLSVVYGLLLTGLQVLERATSGWGLAVHYFRIPWLLDGPWYVTWLTSFVLLMLFFLYGMWYGLVFRRWNLPGLVTFIATQILALVAVVFVIALTHDWSAAGHFFTSVTALELTGVLAAVAAVMGLGGLTTIRRVTV